MCCVTHLARFLQSGLTVNLHGMPVCWNRCLKLAGNNEHDRFECAAKSDENFLLEPVDQIEQRTVETISASRMAWASRRQGKAAVQAQPSTGPIDSGVCDPLAAGMPPSQ